MDIGKEQPPIIIEPLTLPQKTPQPAPDRRPEPVEPDAVPAEV